MNVSSTVELINVGISVISNTVLIFFSVRYSKHNLGTYRYLLMIFAIYDLFLTVFHIILKPKVFNFDTVFAVYAENFPDNSWITLIYCASFIVPFTLTNINFLHRYWAVKNPTKLTLFSNPCFAVALSMYPIGVFLGWLLLDFQLEIDNSRFVETYYFAHFNKTITGWRIMHHWKNGHFQERPFFIILIAIIVMTLNVSITFFLAISTVMGIRNAKSFSSNFRALQFKILRALFAQTSVPVVFVYIPFGGTLLMPFLWIDDAFHIANLCLTASSFFPALDPIIIILLIKDNRDALLSCILPRALSSSVETTIWKTQITQVASK